MCLEQIWKNRVFLNVQFVILRLYIITISDFKLKLNISSIVRLYRVIFNREMFYPITLMFISKLFKI